MGSLSALYGWYNSQWRKMGLIPSISGAINDNIVNTNATVGTNNIDADTVPSNQIWVVQSCVAFNTNTNPTFIQIGVLIDSVFYHFARFVAPGANVPSIYEGNTVLFPGYILRCQILGCAAGDDITFRYKGYYTEIVD